MVRKEFIEKSLNKQVYVEFINEKTNSIETIRGILSDFNERFDKHYPEDIIKRFIEIENNSGIDVIPIKNINKIIVEKN